MACMRACAGGALVVRCVNGMRSANAPGRDGSDATSVARLRGCRVLAACGTAGAKKGAAVDSFALTCARPRALAHARAQEVGAFLALSAGCLHSAHAHALLLQQELEQAARLGANRARENQEKSQCTSALDGHGRAKGDSKKARCQLGTSGRCAAWAARCRRGAWGGVRMSVPCGDPTAPLLAPRPTSACQSRLGLSRLGGDGVCMQACLQKQCEQCKPSHTCDMGTEANFVRLAASRCWPRTPELHEIGGRTPPTLLEARRIAYACAFACVKRREPRNPHGCRDS
ncbi:hypothetical protein L1887_59061 [Cichorium endivia]|nr:hypothetical protein L1887_59061 [Cichorium endivia]